MFLGHTNGSDIKKRNKPKIADEVIQEAVRVVSEGELSPRTAASKYDITRTALFYQVKKFTNDDLSEKCDTPVNRYSHLGARVTVS